MSKAIKEIDKEIEIRLKVYKDIFGNYYFLIGNNHLKKAGFSKGEIYKIIPQYNQIVLTKISEVKEDE